MAKDPGTTIITRGAPRSQEPSRAPDAPEARTVPPPPGAPGAGTPADGQRRRLGPYEVVSFLGKGGMGSVYRGFDRTLQRAVALKVLDPRLASDQSLVERFFVEARLVAKVDHENVCGIYYMDREPGAGTPYFAMELVDGESVEQVLDREGFLPVDRALSIARQAAEGLKVAYAKGIIHRDVKPANLMVTKEGVVKVTDFGLAKALEGGAGLTQANVIMGTCNYMSPEAGAGRPCDHRNDIYALGATLFQLLTGRLPYEGPSAMSVLQRHATEGIPDASALRPSVPAPVAALVRKMMAKAPADRHASWDALIVDLEAVRKGSAPAETSARPAPAPATLAPRVSLRRRWRLKVGLAAATALGSWLFVLGKPGMVHVPGGTYKVGAPDALVAVVLEPFYIDRYEVTNAAYQRAQGLPPPSAEIAALPRVVHGPDEVARYLAATGLSLPTEQQWQAAARGPFGQALPWGDETGGSYVEGRVKIADSTGRPAPVGTNALDRSPSGCCDMAGNVRECVVLARPPAQAAGSPVHAMMGGSYATQLEAETCAAPSDADWDDDSGFRCVSPAGTLASLAEGAKLCATGLVIVALALLL